MEFAFGDLLDSFTDDETAVLAALAYFTKPAHLDWLPPLTNLSQTATSNVLEDLHDRSLLLEDEINNTWFLPPLTALFLRQQHSDAINATRQRLEEQAFKLATEHGDRDKEPYTKLKAAWPTVHAALPLLIIGDTARLQKLCSALIPFLNYSGYLDELLSLSLEAEKQAVAAGDFANAGSRTRQAG